MKYHFTLMLLLLSLFYKAGYTQKVTKNEPINKELLSGYWPAWWISVKDIAQREYGVYHFRKSFKLKNKPASFIIHLSADNRYRFFVNGIPVCSGPARGDLHTWYFETIDIAPYLSTGVNVLAAQVWNMGTLAPVAQISNETGFVVQGNGTEESVVNTDSTWKSVKNTAYQPCSTDNMSRLQAYMVTGPGDQLDAALYPWGWEKADFEDKNWHAAALINHPITTGYGTDNQWTLVPRNIPLMEECAERFHQIRRSEGFDVNAEFLEGKHPVTIPAYKTVQILFDQKAITVAYPELKISGGKGAKVYITYAEALLDNKGNKGNRNDIEGKRIYGNYDLFLPDGTLDRTFRPLWLRTYRYVELSVITAEQPLVLEDFSAVASGYPLKLKAAFTSNEPALENIWKTGWRTAQLCAGETYYDCPYYEQLQYVGDTKIQALISLYLSGDDRLMRKAILDFDHSRISEGLTQGRYPSNRLQVIPTFSLFWISMLHDYWMLKRDDAFIRQFLPSVYGILDWYHRQLDVKKGMLGPMRWWNFVDWDNFNNGWGVAPGATTGNSSIISLQYAYTLKQAADLFGAFGKSAAAKDYREQASLINKYTVKNCFNTGRGLIGDTPDQKTFSQHANIWAILSEAVTGQKSKDLMLKLISEQAIGKVTFFYEFYLTRALVKTGMADQYISRLTPWTKMLRLGLSTFAEKPEPARSDCHAWSASPCYEFLATVCGIRPAAPGFRKIMIQPAMGNLKEISGCMPHPDGAIKLTCKKIGTKGLHAEIILPEKLIGSFIWKGKVLSLHGGKQVINF